MTRIGKRSSQHYRSFTMGLLFLILLSFLFQPDVVVSSNLSSKRASAASESTASTLEAETFTRDADKLRGEQRAEAYGQAIEKYRAAAALAAANKNYEFVAFNLNCAGEVHQVLGNLTEAISSFNESMSFSKNARSQIEAARALNGLAYAYFLRGDAQAAHDASAKALQLGKLLGDKRVEATALSNLGESFYSLGDLQTAQNYQQQAVELFTTLGDFQGRVLAQVALGYYALNLSEPHSALDFLQQGLDSAKQANDFRSLAIALNAIGNIKSKLGRKQEALDAYNQARPLAERVGDKLFLASILGGMGSVHYSLGDSSTAIELHQQATQLFMQLNATWGVAEGKLDLGRIKNSLGHSQEALEDLNEALTLFRSLKMRRLEVESLREIGVALTAGNDFTKALHAFEDARKLARSGQDLRYEANALNLIGQLYENQKQRERALEYYQQALAVSRQAQDSASESSALYKLARIERDNGNLVEASKLAESAISIGESIRAMVSSKDLRASYFATIHQIYELYIDVMMLRLKTSPAERFDVKAFAISEKARARTLLESLQEGRTEVREGVDPKLLEQERSISETLNAKADRHIKLLSSKNAEEAEKVKREIDALTVEYSTVRDQIRASGSRYASLTLPEPLTLGAIQQRLLDDQTVLLEYSLGDDRSYVGLVTQTGLSTYQLPGRKEIETAAQSLYAEFVAHQPIAGESNEQTQARQKQSDEMIRTASATLSKLLLEPLAGKLGNKRLVIIPDSVLQYIPFQTLNDPDLSSSSPQPLLKNHEIVYEPSASTLAVLLKEAAERKTPSNSVAVLADPVFEVDDPRVKRASTESTPESEESKRVKQALRDIGISADGVQIPRLYASGKEAESIVSYAPWGTSLKAVGFDANRARVFGAELSDYRVIHFATHGLINNEHPELSGIVFSLFDSQGRSQDGFLRLHDIYNLRLPTDLVVLSACSTGLGKDVRGEGLISLTRGFMYAGASGVVASLWKVDDEATAELMKLFYEGMFKKGLSPAAALRQAQLELAQQKKWQSPYYWAGFVIQGRYDEQVKGSRFSYLTPKRISVLLGSVVGLSILAFLLFRRRRRRYLATMRNWPL